MMTSAQATPSSMGADPHRRGRGPATRARTLDDLDRHARIPQVLRVSVTLGSVADDGDVLPLDDRQIGVVVVEQLCHGRSPYIESSSGRCPAVVLRTV